MPNPKPIVALMYDFDKTLCTKDMQEYGFIPALGMAGYERFSFQSGYGFAVSHSIDMNQFRSVGDSHGYFLLRFQGQGL